MQLCCLYASISASIYKHTVCLAVGDVTENQRGWFPVTWVKSFICMGLLILILFSVRINHTVILDDPFEDPPGLSVPDRSPEPTKEQLDVSAYNSFLGKNWKK